jgi:hypothetical protein
MMTDVSQRTHVGGFSTTLRRRWSFNSASYCDQPPTKVKCDEPTHPATHFIWFPASRVMSRRDP